MSEEMSVLPIPEGLQVSGRLKEGLSPTDQFAVDSFITAHAALFGVQEKPHPGVDRYQYGTTPMKVGDPLNKRGLTLYLEKRKRMFFVLSRATKNDKRGLSLIKLGSQLAFIALTRVEEVLRYVKGLDSELAGQRDPKTQKNYELFNVAHRKKQLA